MAFLLAMIRPPGANESKQGPVMTSAANSIDAPEVIEVDDTRVACDGGGGALGHPRVYLEMGDESFVECPYCDRRFVLRAGAGHH